MLRLIAKRCRFWGWKYWANTHEGIIFHGGCTAGNGIAYWLTYLENCIVRGARAKHCANVLAFMIQEYSLCGTSLTLIKYNIPPHAGI